MDKMTLVNLSKCRRQKNVVEHKKNGTASERGTARPTMQSPLITTTHLPKWREGRGRGIKQID